MYPTQQRTQNVNFTLKRWVNQVITVTKKKTVIHVNFTPTFSWEVTPDPSFS